MRAEGPNSALLNKLTGWNSGEGTGTAVSDAVRLSANPDGPLALNSPDGSLGRLVMPRGMALDEELTLYILILKGDEREQIKRYDPQEKAFKPLPNIGGKGKDSRQFEHADNIAIVGHTLYVVDSGNSRVQVFDLYSGALVHVWGGKRHANLEEHMDWHPVDVFATDQQAYILDHDNGRVYRNRPERDFLEKIIDSPENKKRWTRVIVGRDGHIYLYDREHNKLDIYDDKGKWLKSVADSGDVRDQFDTPVIYMDYTRHYKNPRFILPESLTLTCDRQMPKDLPAPDSDLRLLAQTNRTHLFSCDGKATWPDPDDLMPPPQPYQNFGTWFSMALDSEIYQCQWHRIEMTMAALPPGTHLKISTFADNERRPNYEVSHRPDYLWDQTPAIIASVQSEPDPDKKVEKAKQYDLLVQSGTGRYLWVKIELWGDGFVSPAIEALRIHYPRDSYLQYLPAIFSADDESRRFLEHFLAITQTEWDAIETRVANIAAYFDPEAVEEGPFMDELAGWLALPLEGSWNVEQNRRMLAAAPAIYTKRGTVEGLRDYLRIYLQNMTGISPKDQNDFPQIVEGFRERQQLMLSLESDGTLGAGFPLWGAGVVKRLQLGVYSREGEVELVSTGDPQSDVFREYAHRFRVFVPAAWVADADAEDMLRRALDAEKPAHTQYDLCLVQPCFRLDQQCSIGLDTILGEYPTLQLADPDDTQAAPSKTPITLGTSVVLAGQPHQPEKDHLSPGMVLGE